MEKRHLCCSGCTACEAAERTVHFMEALMNNELGATFGPPCLCCTAKWMKKWIVIFFFVFCVFVECVLINMSNSNSVWFSSFRVQVNKIHRDNIQSSQHRALITTIILILLLILVLLLTITTTTEKTRTWHSRTPTITASKSGRGRHTGILSLCLPLL